MYVVPREPHYHSDNEPVPVRTRVGFALTVAIIVAVELAAVVALIRGLLR